MGYNPTCNYWTYCLKTDPATARVPHGRQVGRSARNAEPNLCAVCSEPQGMGGAIVLIIDRQDRPHEDSFQTPQTAIEERLTKAWLTWGHPRSGSPPCSGLGACRAGPLRSPYSLSGFISILLPNAILQSAVGLSRQLDDPSSCQRSQHPRCVHRSCLS